MDYPKDWETIALAIGNEADWHCVECGRPCRRPGQRWLDFANALVDWGYGEELTDPQRFNEKILKRHPADSAYFAFGDRYPLTFSEGYN